MSDRDGKFIGEDPFQIVRIWMADAEAQEPNDPNAIALSTVFRFTATAAKQVATERTTTKT